MRPSISTIAFAAALAGILLAGCTAPTDDSRSQTPPVTATMHALSFAGTTAQGGCVFVTAPAPAGDDAKCEYPTPGNEFASLGNGTGIARASGNLTWTATTPAAQTMGLFLVAKENGTWVWHEKFGAVGGTSPLAFDVKVAALLAAANSTASETALRVIELGPASQITCAGPLPVCEGTFAEVGQAFTIQGTLTTQPA